MMDQLIDILSRAEQALPLLLLRASFILVMAFGAAFMFRKHAALNRLVWMSAIVVVLLLPATLPVKAWRFSTRPAVAEAAVVESPSPATHLFLPTDIESVSAPAEEVAIPVLVHRPHPVPAVAETVRLPWLSMIWALGSVLGCIYLLAGRLAIRSLRSRRAELDANWKKCAIDLGCDVRISFVADVEVPMTTGIRSPEILLPDSAREFDRVQRESVLRHELAHVRGRDSIFQALASLVVATQWMNPLAWLAARSLRFAQERVCDEAALGDTHVAPADYAQILLQVARSSRSFSPTSAALMMAHQSSLERRIHLILDRNMKRKTPSKSQVSLTVASVLILSLPLALLGYGEDEGADAPGAKAIPADPETIAAIDDSAQPVEVHSFGSIHWKLKKLILPELDFDDATLQEGIDFFRKKSIELDTTEQDPDRRGINFVILKSQLDRPDRSDAELDIKTHLLRDEVKQLEQRMNQIAVNSNLIDADLEVDDEVYRTAKLRFEEQKFEVAKSRTLISNRMDLDGDELITLLASEDGSTEIARLYPKYRDMKRELAAIERDSGVPDKIKAARITTANEELAELEADLVGAVEHYRRKLGTEIRIEEQNLANAKTALDSLVEDMRNWRARSSDYRAAKRKYELKLSTLGKLEQVAAERSAKLSDTPDLATLDLKSVPLEVALTYFTQQIGASFAVQPFAVVIGSPAEIAALDK